MQIAKVILFLGFVTFAGFTRASAVLTQKKQSFLGNGVANSPQSKSNTTLVRIVGGGYGENGCRCVGIDNLRGYSAATIDNHHVEYPLESGASCDAWDKGVHPECKEDPTPQWCLQKWCYVDPCSCDIEVTPKKTKLGLVYQGKPAYWSYATCGGTDLYTAQYSGDACVMQKDAASCAKGPECAWDGKKCGGKEVMETCTSSSSMDASIGEEDCRCVGLGGRGPGKAWLYINDKGEQKAYPPDVGSVCHAWEADVHPDCLGSGSKPTWCDQKWCYVDPCKCKTKVAPKAVMEANADQRYQGKTAYWSYATCGSTDSWSSSGAGQYCINQKTEAACTNMKKCAWTGTECMGIALAEICAEQESSGMLGVEEPLGSGVENLKPFWAMLLLVLMALKVA